MSKDQTPDEATNEDAANLESENRTIVRLSPTTRLEAFSDGVMAIAITLLILEIKVPHGSLGRGLLHLWPSYLAYVVSFLTIGIIWLNHHAFFGRIRQVDGGLQWWNLMLLLTVSFLPFPTAVVAEHVPHGGNAARLSVAFYGFSGVLMSLPWVFLWRRLARNPGLFEAGYDAALARSEGNRAWVGVVVYAVCIAVGLLSPVAAMILLGLVAIFYAITSQGWSKQTTG